MKLSNHNLSDGALNLVHGAERQTAKKIGVPLEEVVQRKREGYSYCLKCKDWILKADMAAKGLVCREHYNAR